jgi:3-methylcrotonyl-CoA carboxylase alpha subunit
MIAKLVVHGRDRGDALARLRTALAEVEIAGVTTNVEFLRKVAASRAFSSAELDTGLIERNRAELISSIDLDPFLATAAFAELAHEEAEARRLAVATGDPFSPWHHVDGWQLNAEAHHDFVFVEGGAEHPVRVRFGDDGPRISIAGREYHGKSTKTRAVLDGNDWHVLCDGVYRRLSLKSELAGDAAEAAGSLTAPMPGRIVKVMTKPGAKVGKGEALLILEAMKMEHTITAPKPGRVKAVHYAAGEQVLEGAELVTLE